MRGERPKKMIGPRLLIERKARLLYLMMLVVFLLTPHDSRLTTSLWAETPETKLSSLDTNSQSPVPSPQSPLSFLPNTRISDIAKQSFWAHTFSSGGHNIAVHGTEVYAAWYDVRNRDSDIFFAKSTNGGMLFGSSVRVNDDRGNSRQYKPSLAVDSAGNIYLLWRDDRRGHADIYFSKSTNGGKSFSKNRRVNDDPEWAYQGNPALGVSPGGSLYAAWSDSRNNEEDDIYFSASLDRGRRFSRNLRLNDDEGRAVQSHPTVGAGSGGLVIVAWEDFRNGRSEIFMTRSTDGGKTFKANQTVIPQAGRGQQVSPSIAVNEKGWVAIAWAEFTPEALTLAPPNAAKGETLWWEKVRIEDADIYIAVSTDGGARFGAPIRINDDPPGSPQAFPSVAMNNLGRLFVAWEDLRNGQADIYFAKLESVATPIRYPASRFSPNRRVNDDTAGAPQYHPSLSVDEEGRSYLLWTDGRENPLVAHEGHERGNDVYFTRGK